MTSVAQGAGGAFHQFSCNADHQLVRPHAGHAFGLTDRLFRVLNDGGNVGDRPALHLSQSLTGFSHAQNLAGIAFHLNHQRFDKLGPDVQREDMVTGAAQFGTKPAEHRRKT